jgi:hypothetical protein
VGDVKEIVETAHAGYVIDHFTKDDFKKAIDTIPVLMQTDPASIRNAIENIYSLEKGVQSYLSAYRKVLDNQVVASQEQYN